MHAAERLRRRRRARADRFTLLLILPIVYFAGDVLNFMISIVSDGGVNHIF